MCPMVRCTGTSSGSKIVKGLPGGRSEYFVYTPPRYQAHAATSYLTLYLLHGMGQVRPIGRRWVGRISCSTA
jgi:hypothetical protein